MQRSRKIIVTSHCVLNQNTVIPGEARAPGMMQGAVEWCREQGYGIVQLPCPEFTYLGPERPGMTYEQYDTPAFRAHSRKLLAPVVEQLVHYQQHGYELVGGLGIERSPSCDPARGVFMEELHALCAEAGLSLSHFWQVPATDSGHFDPTDPRVLATRS